MQNCNITMFVTILRLTPPNSISAWDAGKLIHYSPDPLAVFKGPVSKGWRGKGQGEKIGREGGKNGGRGP